MSKDGWTITVITPGKIYRGKVNAAHLMDKRTIFLLNNSVKTTVSSNVVYTIEHFIHMDDVVVKAAGDTLKFDTVAVSKRDIIFVYDEFRSMGTEQERKRFQSMVGEGNKNVLNIMTRMRNRQCYSFTCEVINPKQKLTSKDKFIALSNVRVERLSEVAGEQKPKPLELPFVALNKRFIETIHSRPVP